MTSSSPGLYLSSTGSYPRVGDGFEFQVLRRAIAGLDRGERTTADVLDAENEMTRRAISDQVKAGLEIVTDGQIRWYDPVSHLAGKLQNVKIKGLLRFFDTNTYFRQPVLSGKPVRKAALLADEYAFARNSLGHLPTPGDKAGKLSIKPVLTGPYTLAKLSLSEPTENGSAGSIASLEGRAIAYADALAAEIAVLAQAGASLIQIDEPAIVKYPQDWPIFDKSLAPLVQARDRAAESGRRADLAIYAYFHDAAPLYDKLVELPVDAVGLDFTYNPKLVDVVAAAGSPKALGLGLVDGRNTRIEDVAGVARQLERLLPKIQGGRAYLGTSSGLEYLPHERAFAKLALLGKIRAALNG
jgi:5-methyltetrahydropteroyltriglutamate--homocysteine methyltransferase